MHRMPAHTSGRKKRWVTNAANRMIAREKQVLRMARWVSLMDNLRFGGKGNTLQVAATAVDSPGAARRAPLLVQAVQ